MPHIKNQKKSLSVKALFFLAVTILATTCLFVSESHAADSAQKNFTSITQEEMKQIESLHQRAEKLIAGHNFRDAIDVYSEILLTEPDDDEAYTRMGQSYMILGDFKRAKDAFQNALDINPDNEIAAIGLRKIADPDFS